MLDNQEEICLSKETAAEAQKYIDLLLPIVEAEAVSRDANVNGGSAQQERIEGDSFPSIVSAVKFLPSPVVVPMSEIRVDTDGNNKDARDIQLRYPHNLASSTVILSMFRDFVFRLFYRRRDVERDNFLLNETPLRGSNGFDFILDTVIDQLHALAQDLAWWCESNWPLQQFAYLILRAGRLTACCLFGVLLLLSIALLMIPVSTPILPLHQQIAPNQEEKGLMH